MKNCNSRYDEPPELTADESSSDEDSEYNESSSNILLNANWNILLFCLISFILNDKSYLYVLWYWKLYN